MTKMLFGKSSLLPRQSGVSVVAVIVVVAVLVVGVVIYKERSRAAARAEQQRVELAQKAEQQRLEQEREQAEAREREERAAQEKRAADERRDQLRQALAKFDDAVVRFYDASRVASGTSRIALAQPVATMQSVHREVGQLQVPPCLATGRDDLLDGMKSMVEAYLVFMQNPAKIGNELAQIHFDKAEKGISRYKLARDACNVA
jgi:hypothetical protein